MNKLVSPQITKNMDKIITTKNQNGFKVIKTWVEKSDKCDLISKEIKNEFTNITQKLINSNGLKGLQIEGELNKSRLGVNITHKISGYLRGQESFINLNSEELIKELFKGKYDDTISLQKNNKARRIWKKLSVKDYVLNENEFYSLRSIINKTFVHKASFPGFKYNGMNLNISEDFEMNKLTSKAQKIAKQIIEEFNNIQGNINK